MGKIAEALRKAMKDSGLSRYEIAKRAKVSQGTLSKFMSKKHDITIETMERISNVVGFKFECEGKSKK